MNYIGSTYFIDIPLSAKILKLKGDLKNKKHTILIIVVAPKKKRFCSTDLAYILLKCIQFGSGPPKVDEYDDPCEERISGFALGQRWC